MNLIYIVLILSFISCEYNLSQKNNVNTQEFLEFIKGKDSLVDDVLNNHEKYRLQIIYGQVTHHSKDSVSIANSSLLKQGYYYPASTIKLPCALLTLEKLNELNIDENHYFRISDEFLCGNITHVNNSHKSRDSFHELIKEMVVVSNNVSFNSVYEFLTPGYIKKKLNAKSMNNIHIYRKFAGCSMSENLKCNSVSIYDQNDHFLYKQEASVLNLSEMAENYNYNKNNLIGTYSYRNNKTIKKPYDFNYNNSASLEDLHLCLINLIYPSTVGALNRWNLLKSDRDFLIRLLGMYPRELKNDKYSDSEKYPDNFLKYIVFGDTKSSVKRSNIRTFSKIGLSYGFTTEVAYVVDLELNIEYFLSISMYTNQNKTVNDGIYEYDEISKPFLGKLGTLLLEYESNRTSSNTPDFSSLKLLYD